MTSERRAALLVVLLVVAACSPPVPPDPSRPTASPTAPATAFAVASVTPAPSKALVTFAADSLTFEYPDDWAVLAAREWVGPDYTFAVVGTGAWESGCEETGNGYVCLGPELITDPGEVVVQIFSRISGPAALSFVPPPFEAGTLPSRLPVAIVEARGSTTAEIFIPGHRSLLVEARYSEAAQRADVSTLLNSVRFNFMAPPLVLADWAGHRANCVEETRQGRLSRGDHPWLVLSEPEMAQVLWPARWSITVADDGRAALHDETGTVVAREWDEISVGGHGDVNEFRVCPNAVDLIRPFASSD